eukprot:321339_1
MHVAQGSHDDGDLLLCCADRNPRFCQHVLAHVLQGLARPLVEPCDGGVVDQGREHSDPSAERLAHGGEAEYDMHIPPHVFDEPGVQGHLRRADALAHTQGPHD